MAYFYYNHLQQITIPCALKAKKEQPESCSLMLSSEIIVTVLD